jgi:hypothetical protein
MLAAATISITRLNSFTSGSLVPMTVSTYQCGWAPSVKMLARILVMSSYRGKQWKTMITTIMVLMNAN